MTDAAYRCATASLLRDDQLVGSATRVPAFLLVEHPGPWGQAALRDAALPGNLLAGLRRRSTSTGVRILLVRRHRQRGQEGVRVFAARPEARGSWVETTVLDSHHDVLDLDLEALGAGRSPGLEPHAEALFCVCTHGRHDACCAERGRPVAAELSRTHPAQTWEISHLGGDRFAANLLVLGAGLGYGRVTPEVAPAIADAHLDGRITPDHLRGRAAFTMPVQAAELAVRRALDVWEVDALRLDSWAGGRARFAVDGDLHEVLVTRRLGDAHRLTCSSHHGDPVPSYTTGPVQHVAASS